jgi:ABC-type polysaccharide/polyol phosphate transport system ATPase subunit
MLSVEHVTKVYDTRQGRRRVLKDVTFQLEKGQHLGIIGRNGAGKSTLIRLLSGAERPTSGHIQRKMRVSWPLAFAGAFHPHLTGLDNLKFICRVYGIDYKPLVPFVESFTELGLYFREPVEHYSYGMMTRLAFALSMAIEFDCFLIDEAMVAGDIRFHERCHHELFVKRKDRAFILVTHDYGPIRDQCDSVCVLHEGRLIPFDDVLEGLEWYRSLMLGHSPPYEAQPLEGAARIDASPAIDAHPTFDASPAATTQSQAAQIIVGDEPRLPKAEDETPNNIGSTKIDRLIDWALPGREYRFALPRIPARRREAGRKTILVLGNCQARPLTACLQSLCPDIAFSGVELPSSFTHAFLKRDRHLHARLDQYERILAQPDGARMIADNFPDLAERVTRFPVLAFSAYHPDLVYARASQDGSTGYLFGPLGHYNSAIALWAYLRALSVEQTVALFNERTYEALGYFNFWQSSCQSLLHEGQAIDMPLEDSLNRWSEGGAFMHSINHPKVAVFADVAHKLLTKLQLPCTPEAAPYIPDEFVKGPVWPIYPEFAERLGITGGSYLFKMEEGAYAPEKPLVMLDLPEFVRRSFDAFGRYDRSSLSNERVQSERFQALEAIVSGEAAMPMRAPSARRTPYSDLPSHQFWKNAVASVPRRELDPVVKTRFQITRETRIATAGSCFAQNLSATLRRFGFNYFITESGAHLPTDQAQRRMYDVYSARYGNVYTARQLLQLFQRCYATFSQDETAWQRADGKFIDPFRPFIEPDGHNTAQIVGIHLLWHLSRVRELFEKLDVLIFTLGLTEAWRSKIDGAVYPVAPGVAGVSVDSSRYEFVNFRVAEVVEDLDQFLALLREVNPRARMILTVSPVPLIATYEPQHALVATTYSKSVLRAAAGEVCARNKNCDYFPSYEIVTGTYSRGTYFERDLRNVTSEGVDHVMRLFLKHYAGERSTEFVDPELIKELSAVKEIYCDEEALAG